MTDMPSPSWIRSAVEIITACIAASAVVISSKLHPKMDKLRIEVDGKMRELLDSMKELAALKAVVAERAKVAQKESDAEAAKAVGAKEERDATK